MELGRDHEAVTQIADAPVRKQKIPVVTGRQVAAPSQMGNGCNGNHGANVKVEAAGLVNENAMVAIVLDLLKYGDQILCFAEPKFEA